MIETSRYFYEKIYFYLIEKQKGFKQSLRKYTTFFFKIFSFLFDREEKRQFDDVVND